MNAARLEDKKIFLIASGSKSKAAWLEEAILKHVSKAVIYKAHDGLTALSKLQNATPHIFITDLDLPKMPGLKLIDHALVAKDAEGMAIIISSGPPPEGHHLDELVTGKVQYFTAENDGNEFLQCLVKGLNFSSQSNRAEFYLRFLAPGDVLLKEGDKADFVYFVRKGQLQAYKLAGEKEVLLGLIEYGEFVGEMAYINGQPRSAHVRAVSNCELIEVPLGKFDKVLFKRPSWSKALMLTLAKRVRAANAGKVDVI